MAHSSLDYTINKLTFLPTKVKHYFGTIWFIKWLCFDVPSETFSKSESHILTKYQHGILMEYISWKYCQILHFDISRLINRFTKTFRLHTSANENGILNRNAVHCSCSKRELFYLTSNILRQNMMMMFFAA